MAHNRFKSLPEEVLGLESVYNLWIHGNEIDSLPTELSQLPSLSHMLLDEEKIRNLDEIKKLMPRTRFVDY